MYTTAFNRLLFPLFETVVKRRGTMAHLRAYGASQWLAPPALQALQLQRLNELLNHAWAQVPFLRTYWLDHGCRPEALGHVDELQRFPLLDKALVRANYEDMIARNWRGRTLTKTTSGSTGSPFQFEYTMPVYARRTAVMWRGYGWAGAQPGTRTAFLWATPPARPGWAGLKETLYHRAFHRRYFDAFALNAENLENTVAQLQAWAPRMVVAYVAPALVLARHLNQRGQVLKGLKGLLTGAEALYEPERHELQTAFGCEVFNTYGSREMMLMASECDEHRGLHVNADHLLLETVDPQGQKVHSGSGAVAVTDFHNLGMPMVRYLIGDSATWGNHLCRCGRGLPLLESVDGRLLDLITTPDGRSLPGEFFAHTMVEFPEVKGWQVVQTAADCVCYHLVLNTPWPAERQALLRQRIQARGGPGLRVEVVQVPQIDNATSGKRRLTVSLAHARRLGLAQEDQPRAGT